MSDQVQDVHGIMIQDYPGGQPRWQKVDPGQLGHAPYNRIFHVRGQSAAGSGWLTAPGKVVTAAHVVGGGQTADVRFADSDNWITATVHVADGYLAPNGKPTASGRLHAEPVSEAPPYPGAKPHLLIEADRWDDAEWLGDLLRVTAAELPISKPRKPKRST